MSSKDDDHHHDDDPPMVTKQASTSSKGTKSTKSSKKAVKAKFKPSRLPACTERVLYYAPAMLQDLCHWSTTRGYEVNYLHAGSDHKPVMLEATLIVENPEER